MNAKPDTVVLRPKMYSYLMSEYSTVCYDTFGIKTRKGI